MSNDKKIPRIKGQAELIGREDERKINRANEIKRDDDTIKELNIGLYEHDDAISYYFNNVIKPTVKEDDNIISVPIIYGNAERWASVQKGYFYRDQKGKIQVPLIMFKRTNVEKNKNLTNKLDANNPRNFVTYEKKYTPKNNYDKFSILNGVAPQKEFHNVIMPDYVKLTYECMIWTNYIEHMNKIIEAINYAEGSYWGEPENFKFIASISGFDITPEASQDTERQIRASFNLIIQGYIISDALQKQLVQQNIGKSFSLSRIVWDVETDADIVASKLLSHPSHKSHRTLKNEAYFIASKTPNSKLSKNKTSSLATSKRSGIVTNTVVFDYLATNIEKVADIVTAPNKAKFTGAIFKQPPIYSGLPDTSVKDFNFFANGQYVDKAAVSFSVTGSDSILTIDTAKVGWDLESDWTVVAIGKFAD